MIGRPNVGKSTLVNRLLGEERVVVFDQPGRPATASTSRSSGARTRYTLIDTAGVRRRSRVDEVVEKFSVIKTLQAIEEANVVLFVLDAQAGVTEQDASLAGHIVESGRSLVIVVNKWDGLSAGKSASASKRSSTGVSLSRLRRAALRFLAARLGGRQPAGRSRHGV